MRLSRDQLVFRALAVCDEAVEACYSGPIQPSLGLRFALMFLYAAGSGERAAHDTLWRIVQDDRVIGSSAAQANYLRSTTARSQLQAIARSVGVELTPEIMIALSEARLSSAERAARQAERNAHAFARQQMRDAAGRVPGQSPFSSEDF